LFRPTASDSERQNSCMPHSNVQALTAAAAVATPFTSPSLVPKGIKRLVVKNTQLSSIT
jgi:hypothetical protein